jgi:hypothetical protein
MIVKCPIHGLKYERFNFDKYATEDCPRCLSDRKHNSEFTYEDGVRSDNRLVLLFSAIILVFFLGMAFVSAGGF